MTERKIRIRGPKGTSGASRIVVHVAGNPKTPIDPSHELWELYGACPTLKDYVNAMHARGLRGKAHKLMTLDARRGYISVEGYAKNRIPFVAFMGVPVPLNVAALPQYYISQTGEPGGMTYAVISLGEEDYHRIKKDCTEGGAVAPVAP